MINPDTLSQDQKRFLKERYHLDVDKRRPYLFRDRILNFLSPWPNVILALGLLLEEPSAGSVLPSKFFEIIVWGWGAFGVFICCAMLIITFAVTRGAASTDEKGREVWSWLFQDRIRWQRRWWHLRWDVTCQTSIGVGLMAFLTGRIGVGVMWTSGLLSLFVVEQFLDHIVRAELARLEATTRASG
jgi:hypothetical protein